MQPLPIVLAAALRARQKSKPGGRLATLTYRYGEEQAQPKYGGGLWVPAASGAALAPADRRAGAPTSGLVILVPLGRRTVVASGWPRRTAAMGRDHFLVAAYHHDDLGNRDK